MSTVVTSQMRAVSSARPQRIGQWEETRRWVGGLLAFWLPLLAYLRTLAPTVYGLDSAELTTAAYHLGLAHAPGYPLYLLLGHLFSKLPISNVGYRLNLMSAVFGALAVLLLYLLLLRLTQRVIVALTAALFLAFSFYFWSAALVAEVYTLHVFLLGSLLLLALTWSQKPQTGILYGFALLFGLSLGNHLAALLLAPGFVVWIFIGKTRVRLRIKQYLLLAGLFLLGTSVYLYLPLRSAAQPTPTGIMQIEISSGLDWFNVVTGRPFWRLLFAYSLPEFLAQLLSYGYALWGNFLSIGLLPAGLGFGVMVKRRPKLALLLLLLFLSNLLFFAGYRVADKAWMFLPTYFIAAIWMGFGLDWVLARIQKGFPLSQTRRGQPYFALVLLLFPLGALLINYPHVDLSQDRRSYERASQLVNGVEDEALLFIADWYEVGPLEYLQLVEGRGPGLALINGIGVSPSEFEQLLDRYQRRPVYSTGDPPWLRDRYRLIYIAVCDCYQVQREPL